MSSYSIRSLEVFAAVADAGSFSAAANQLQISQPSVSEHVHKLEKHLSQALFVRERGRPATLTDAGTRLLTDVRALLGEAQRLRSHASLTPRGLQRQLAVSCHRPLTQAVLAQHLASFASLHPDTALQLHTGSADEVVQRVRSQSADLGVLLARKAPDRLDIHLLGSVEFVIVAGTTHPLAQRSGVSAADLSQCAFLTAPHHSQYADDVSAMLADAGIGPRQAAARASEFSTVLQMAAAGVGLLCAIRRGVQQDIDSGRLRPLVFPHTPLSMNAWAALSGSVSQRATAQALAQHLKRFF